MLKLFIDTISLYPKIVISKNNTVLDSEIILINKKNKLSDIIINKLIKILKSNDVNQISYIGVLNGPGSFTGLRMGVAAAVGLSISLKSKLYGFKANDVLLDFSRRNYNYDNVYIFIQSSNNQKFISGFNKENNIFLKTKKIIKNDEIFKNTILSNSILISNEKIKESSQFNQKLFSKIINIDICHYLATNNLESITKEQEFIDLVYS